jgi:hypothetical protein
MKNSTMQKGSVTLALAGILSAVLVGAGFFVNNLNDYIDKRVQKATEAQMEAELEEVKLGAFRPSGYVGKLLTRLTEGGSESTFNTTPGTAPDDTTLTTAKIGDFVVITINPGASNEEKISASAVSVSGTTATWTIVNRGLSFTENTAVTANKKAHTIGETVIISDDDHFLTAQYLDLDTEQTVTANKIFPYPTASTSPATKGYVDTVAFAGSVNYDQVILSALAGETITQGQIVYYDRYQQEWMKTDSDAASTTNQILLGIAQGAGSNGSSISGGVLVKGIDRKQGGTLTAGQRLYVSGTAGATSTTAGTNPRLLGFSKDADEFYFNPNFGAFEDEVFFTNLNATYSTTTNATTTNFFATTASSTALFASTITVGSSSNIASSSLVAFVASTTPTSTWTKQNGLKYVIVEVIGPGNGGQAGNESGAQSGAGGTGGSYCKKIIAASLLGSTETVTVGAGGAGGTGGGGNGGAAGAVASSFGSHCSASSSTATGGNINITGVAGGPAQFVENAPGSTGGPSAFGGATYGKGGDGGSENDTNGTAGAVGAVFVWEYYY